MSTAIKTELDNFIVTIDDSERSSVTRVAEELVSAGPSQVDEPEWISAARDEWSRLPATLRQTVANYRRDSGPRGILVLHGLPVPEHKLPNTPTVRESVQTEPSVSAAMLLTTACGLGEPIAFHAEKHGALVQDVVPVPGDETVQGNSGSALLTFHTENAFHEHRPDYVMLLCLRADPQGIAGLRVACIRQAQSLLGTTTRNVLASNEFVTDPPPSFGGRESRTVVHPVLSGDPEDPDVRVDFAATKPQTDRAERAMLALGQAFETVAETLWLQPGDLAVLDNRLVVHGRTAFQPRYDGRDRWLQRTFAVADLRRSRGHRPYNGHVLAS